MSDEKMPETTAEAPVAASKKPGFLSTATGKIVAIVVGLGVLGIVAGIAIAIVLYVFGSQAVDELEGQLEQPPASGESAVATATPEVKTPSAELPNAEVFTFRDIFDPLIKPASASTPPAGGSTGTTDTVTPSTPGTLYLDGIVTQDGVLKAQLRYNGQSYTLAAGGVIPNSPWQVLRVSSTSVVMLYGDVQVTLAVGQGISK